MKMLRLLLICLLPLCSYAGDSAERIYIDAKDLDMEEDAFHIHVGDNLWIETSTIHRDATGLYTYESMINMSQNDESYKKQWKCPYCNHYWDIGQPCKNPECPRLWRKGVE